MIYEIRGEDGVFMGIFAQKQISFILFLFPNIFYSFFLLCVASLFHTYAG